jgi:MYXO-CTERM domain-containing protein
MTPMRAGAALLCASLVLAALPCHANGRFPLSQRVFQDQGNPDRLFLSATFGLLLTEDRGENWYHVCEGALTPEALESDILFELMPDGSMLSALVRPLLLSTDCGCTWQPVLGEGMDQWVRDIARSGPNGVVALARTSTPSIIFRVEHSADGGRTWSKVSDLPPRLEAFTIDVAPSDPMRVYVSVVLNQDADAGIAQSTPALLVSEDGGVTWGEPRPIQGTTPFDEPFIATVDPDDADTVFVRTYAWTSNGDTEEADDALFVSDDGGVAFREVLRKTAKLFGFALSPDGETVLAGYGDPQQATRDVSPYDVGIYRASTADFQFSQVLNAPVSCLKWYENGLYACFDGMVGFSADGSIPATPDGFTPILRNPEVRGPLACNSPTCLPQWQEGREDIPAGCDLLRAECDVDTSAHVLECRAPTGGTGGAAGSGGAAGAGATGGAATGGGATGGAGTAAGMGGAVAATGGASTGGATGGTTGGQPNAGQTGGSSDSGSDGSCGCRSPRPASGASALIALALVALAGLLRRKSSRVD